MQLPVIIKQIDDAGGIVVECSASEECARANAAVLAGTYTFSMDGQLVDRYWQQPDGSKGYIKCLLPCESSLAEDHARRCRVHVPGCVAKWAFHGGNDIRPA